MTEVQPPHKLEKWDAIHIQKTSYGWSFNIRGAPLTPGGGENGMIVSAEWKADTFDEIIAMIKRDCILD